MPRRPKAEIERTAPGATNANRAPRPSRRKGPAPAAAAPDVAPPDLDERERRQRPARKAFGPPLREAPQEGRRAPERRDDDAGVPPTEPM